MLLYKHILFYVQFVCVGIMHIYLIRSLAYIALYINMYI